MKVKSHIQVRTQARMQRFNGRLLDQWRRYAPQMERTRRAFDGESHVSYPVIVEAGTRSG